MSVEWRGKTTFIWLYITLSGSKLDQNSDEGHTHTRAYTLSLSLAEWIMKPPILAH